MKPLYRDRNSPCYFAAFNRIELLVVVGLTVALIYIAFFLPPGASVKEPYVDRLAFQRITCENNLKQIGTTYLMWANDNGSRYPFNTPISNGGWNDLLSGGNAGPCCWTNYALMAGEMPSSRVLACPVDIRKPAADFGSFTNNTALSYFVGVQANEDNPKSILGGDRNLALGEVPDWTYGLSPAGGNGNDVVITKPVCWSLAMHSQGNPAGAGNILFADGSVRPTISSEQLRTNILHAGSLRDGIKSAGLRLVFP
jgi:prepilin-type processing-associated H-X9-DG protein